jgi:hypothetical protein
MNNFVENGNCWRNDKLGERAVQLNCQCFCAVDKSFEVPSSFSLKSDICGTNLNLIDMMICDHGSEWVVGEIIRVNPLGAVVVLDANSRTQAPSLGAFEKARPAAPTFNQECSCCARVQLRPSPQEATRVSSSREPASSQATLIQSHLQ